jgi:hypothetical protein
MVGMRMKNCRWAATGGNEEDGGKMPTIILGKSYRETVYYSINSFAIYLDSP